MNRLFFTFLLGLSFLAFPLKAQEKPAYLFVGTQFPLILDKDKNGQARGVAVDLLSRISEKSGVQINIEILPWTRALNKVRNGNATALIGPYKSKEREKFLTYCDVPFYADHMVFIKRKDTRLEWSGDFQKLQNYRILSVQSWSYGPRFDAHRPKMRLSETLGASNAIKMLMHGRTDLLAFNRRNALAELEKQGFTGQAEILDPPFSSRLGYFAFSKKNTSPEFEKVFAQVMSDLEENGGIREINAKYGLQINQPAHRAPIR